MKVEVSKDVLKDIKKGITILNNDFFISFKDKVLIDNEKCYGKIDYNSFMIEVSSDYPIKKINETITHEIMHGLDEAYNIGLKEKQIKLLGKAIHKLFLDNKKGIKDYYI